MDGSLGPKLNLDCLVMVFQAITEQLPRPDVALVHYDTNVPLDSRPLDDIRAASQVCRRWRLLLFASPSTWGRVVDLDMKDYGVKRGEWMDEVLRRAGTTPLWVSGHVFKPSRDRSRFDSQSFFIKVLDSWQRIEKVSVIIFGDKTPDAIQNHFLSSAPMLKFFHVEMLHLWRRDYLFSDTLQPGSSKNLFGNSAPLLQVIKADHMLFRLDSSWLSHLLEIAPIPAYFTMQQVFRVLQQTPNLDTVHVDARFSSSEGSLPTVHLPQLSSIFLMSTISQAAKFLDHLLPGALSSLCIRTVNFSMGSPDKNALPLFRKNLPIFVSNYFASNLSTQVGLKVMEMCFSFYDISKQKRKNQSFDLHIEVPGMGIFQEDINEVFACMLDSIALTCSPGGNPGLFDSISDIKLDLTAARLPIIANMRSMVAIFRRVHDIWTDRGSIQHLRCICFPDPTGGDSQDVLFPELRTLHLIIPKIRHHVGQITQVNLDLSEFLLQRKKTGYPVLKLDLTGPRSSYQQDLSALEEVGGLEVVWRNASESGEGYETYSYICGSGDADQLKNVALDDA